MDLGFLVIDFPVRFLFYLKKDINIEDITVQKDEVESVSYMSENELKKAIAEGRMHAAHVKILEHILEYKKNGKCY